MPLRLSPRWLACFALASATLLIAFRVDSAPALRQSPSGKDKPAFKVEQPSKPTWDPSNGDRGVIYVETGERVVVATTMLFYRELVKLVAAGDQDGVQQMVESKQAVWLTKGTGILVLEPHDNELIANHIFLELRVTDGEHRGLKVYAPVTVTAKSLADAAAVKKAREDARRAKQAAEKAELDAIMARRAEEARKEAEAMKRKADAKRRVEEKKEKQRQEAQKKRPVTLLSQAKKLEENEQTRQALDFYRRIVKEYPGSDQAKEARERIKAIEANPPKS